MRVNVPEGKQALILTHTQAQDLSSLMLRVRKAGKWAFGDDHDAMKAVAGDVLLALLEQGGNQ